MLRTGFQAGCPREPEGGSEAESRARGNNAGPLARLPAPDSYAGSAAPSIVGGQPPPIFTRAGRHPQDIAEYLRLPRHRPTGCSTQIVQVCVAEEASLRDVSCGCFQVTLPAGSGLRGSIRSLPAGCGEQQRLARLSTRVVRFLVQSPSSASVHCVSKAPRTSSSSGEKVSVTRRSTGSTRCRAASSAS